MRIGGIVGRQGIKRTALALFIAAWLPAISTAHAQQFPVRPVKLIVPYAPGGSTDVVARIYAQKYGEQLGQPLVIENRPGASALIGMRAAIQAPADGYTLLISTPTHNIATVVYKEPGFALSDFVLVAPIGSTAMVLVQNGKLPFKTLKETIAYAKINPSKLNTGTLGGGAITQMLISRFNTAADISTTDVYFKGNSAVAEAILAGTIDLYIDAAPTAVSHLTSGKLRGLAVTTERRLPQVPDIPTFKELGFPIMTGGAWFGIFTNAKVPASVVQHLRTTGAKTLAAADLSKKLSNDLFVEPWSGSIEEFDKFLKDDVTFWRRDAERLGLVGTL